MKSIRIKLYLFIAFAIILMASGTIIFSYVTSKRQIDDFYMKMTTDNAKNFATSLTGDYMKRLRAALESEEYQEIRKAAEEAEDEEPVREYLNRYGLWQEYDSIRRRIDKYLFNMSSIEYLYIFGHGDKNALQDMYMVDTSDEPIYESGSFEEREEAFLGKDLVNIGPTISYSDTWGWLCTDYAPVYDSDGNCVCVVGCDVAVDDMVSARRSFLLYVTLGAAGMILLVTVGAVIFISRTIVRPLRKISGKVQEFQPSENMEDAQVISLNLKGKNEITEIYENIRNMELMIVDHIRNKTYMQQDIVKKESEINLLSIENFKDSLTHVGNKGAYLQKLQEINNAGKDFAIVMVDINNLKKMNDELGHKAGDMYILGCCKMVCQIFLHSPVFRIGGDEFVVIVENEDYPNRYSCVERLRENFEKSFNKVTNKPWEKYSAAVGMAESSAEARTAEQVFKLADEAMYEDKMKFKEKYGSYR